MLSPSWVLANADTLQIGLFFTLLAAFAVAERLAPRRPGPLDRRMRWPANYFLTVVNFAAMGILPVSIVAAAVWAAQHGVGLLNTWTVAPWAAIAVTLLARAFVSFFTHYLMHMVPAFWRVHRVHHLDTELDVSTTVRFHPLEFVIQALPSVPLIVAIGGTPWVLACYELLDVAVNLWSHSNLRVPEPLDRVLRLVIVTPDLHRIHHSAWKAETNSNFGAVFPIWDLVFRTFRATPREPHEGMRLGLDELRGRDAHRPLWLLGSVARGSVGEGQSRAAVRIS
jgi:sterol desaturase/sphingolipid hydroxylase (fatty acid hydroxylase superfamily)